MQSADVMLKFDGDYLLSPFVLKECNLIVKGSAAIKQRGESMYQSQDSTFEKLRSAPLFSHS